MMNFYSIEYVINDEIDIKHAFMTEDQAKELSEMLCRKGVQYSIYCLSKSNVDVKSLDDDRERDVAKLFG